MVSNLFLIIRSITAAIIDITTNIMKNDEKVEIGIPKRYGVGKLGSGYNVLNWPASMLANALVKNHTPIMRQQNLAGESFDTIDNPIGDMHSSPNVKRT